MSFRASRPSGVAVAAVLASVVASALSYAQPMVTPSVTKRQPAGPASPAGPVSALAYAVVEKDGTLKRNGSDGYGRNIISVEHTAPGTYFIKLAGQHDGVCSVQAITSTVDVTCVTETLLLGSGVGVACHRMGPTSLMGKVDNTFSLSCVGQ